MTDILELAKRVEAVASQFNQLRSTIAVRFEGRTEYSLWIALNKAFDDLEALRAGETK